MVRKLLQWWEPNTASTALDEAIETLNLAKDMSSATPAQAAFASVTVVLVMVKVRFPLLCGDGLPVHIYLGLYGLRRGLHQACTALC